MKEKLIKWLIAAEAHMDWDDFLICGGTIAITIIFALLMPTWALVMWAVGVPTIVGYING